jgi:adenine-specific DNA-methyltransferase
MGSLLKTYSQEKLNGKVYTPSFIVKKILDDVGFVGKDILGKKILDPACGDGSFLKEIVKRIIAVSPLEDLEKNLSCVYGWDIDEQAIRECIVNLNNLTDEFGISVKWNIKVQDAIKMLPHSMNLFSASFNNVSKFDYIVGNPPYVRIQHLEEKQRKFIQKNYTFCKNGSTDIYIAFFELAYHLINENGICGFITPNTYFYTETAKSLRELLAQNQHIKQITNYGHIQLFDNATTYSAITIFNHKKNKHFIYQQAITKYDFTERKISYSEIQNKKIWQLSTSPIVFISKKANTKRLGEVAKISVGITTLCDKAYIFQLLKFENQYAYVHSKLKGEFLIEKEILKPIIKASKLPSSLHQNEYVLFPYKKVNNFHQIISEEELKELYPLAYNYLLSVKDILDKRDNGKPNPVAWYAFGRNQSLNNSFGKKILFSPINQTPRFYLSENENATFYSGYAIKFDGNYEKLLLQLNSEKMKEFIQVSSRDFRGGWKAYNKKVIEDFPIDVSSLF